MVTNILPIRKTYLAAGTIFTVVNCTWYNVENLDASANMYVRNLMNDGNEDSTVILPRTSINNEAPMGGQVNYAQVIFDGSDAPFTVICDGKIIVTPYATAAELQAAGYL